MLNTAYEPVLVRTAITAALTAVLHAGVVLGWVPITEDAESAVAGAIDLCGVAVAAVWSRQGVVPVAKIEDALASSEGVIESGAEETYGNTTLGH